MTTAPPPAKAALGALKQLLSAGLLLTVAITIDMLPLVIRSSRNRNLGCNYHVPMVLRVLSVFEAFQSRPRLFMTEVMETCRLPRASAFRILETLREAGYLIKDDKNRYRLTYKLLEIASITRHRDPLRSNALTAMDRLHRDVGETVNLGIFEENRIVYAEVLESPHPLRLVPRIGTHACFYATALGKAVSAWLPPEMLIQLLEKAKFQRFTPNTIVSLRVLRRELARIREVGHAVDQEEETRGVVCVGAPIFDVRGRVIAAISIAAPDTRMTRPRIRQIARLLQNCCAEVSQKLGFCDPTRSVANLQQ